MKRRRLPYRVQPTKNYIEIMPAALLSRRKSWEGVARGMPRAGCLLVTNLHNQQVMRQISQALKEKGRQVVIWIDEGREDAYG